MTKNPYIESYITYQNSTDKSPATLASYRSDLIQFAIWFEVNQWRGNEID